MVNKVGFINRLKKVMEHHQLTASGFADAIGVQRSSISHILSGRNKPSLDFVLKITTKFTDVDIYWLLNEKGTFPKVNTAPTSMPLFEASAPLFETEKVTSTKKSIEKRIQRIVIFYDNGTFEEYKK